MISAKSLGENAAAEARVGLAGPILGTIGTLIPLAAWLATGSRLWRALAYIGFFIKLINLLPVLPQNRHSEETREYHSVPLNTKLAVAAVYLSLAVLLIIGTADTYVARSL